MNTKLKYTQEDVENIFLQKDLFVNDKYERRDKKIHCKDSCGYKYCISLADVLSGRMPYKAHKSNPYSIENIMLFLEINNSKTKILSSQYVDSKSDLECECECGTSFKTTWNSMLDGKRYCNFCAKSKRWDDYKNYYEIIKDKCEKLDYDLLSNNINRCNDIVEYICQKHKDKGIQTSNPELFINRNHGCKYCGYENFGITQRLPEDEIIRLVNEKGFIYVGIDYDNPEDKSKRVNVYYLCPRHLHKGIQKIKYHNLKMNKIGCRYCHGFDRTRLDLQQEIDNIHGEIEILYFDKYSEPILCKCKKCGLEWYSYGVYLTQGHGCPKCPKSYFESEVIDILNKYNITYKSQYRFDDCRDKNPLPFDFLLNDYGILIEADGEGHYMPIRRGSMTQEEAENQFEIVKYHDEIKTAYCIKNNIPLIRIPYWERKNIENFICDKLSLNNYNTSSLINCL